MVIRTAAKPTKPTLSNVVLVERYEDQVGKWNLSFTLQDRKFDEVFLRLPTTCTLDQPTRPTSKWRSTASVSCSTSGAGSSSRDRRPAVDGGTSRASRGAVAAARRVQQGATNRGSGRGLAGSHGTASGLLVCRGRLHEAKSIGPATTRVKISSENQLDADDLELLVLLVGNTDEQTAGAVNLPT